VLEALGIRATVNDDEWAVHTFWVLGGV
jgi:hypothetical protein